MADDTDATNRVAGGDGADAENTRQADDAREQLDQFTVLQDTSSANLDADRFDAEDADASAQDIAGTGNLTVDLRVQHDASVGDEEGAANAPMFDEPTDPTLHTGDAGTQQAAFFANIDAIDTGVGETTEAAVSAGIAGDTANGTASVSNVRAADDGRAATAGDAFNAESSSDGDGPSAADSDSGDTTDSGIPTGNAASDAVTDATDVDTIAEAGTSGFDTSAAGTSGDGTGTNGDGGTTGGTTGDTTGDTDGGTTGDTDGGAPPGDAGDTPNAYGVGNGDGGIGAGDGNGQGQGNGAGRGAENGSGAGADGIAEPNQEFGPANGGNRRNDARTEESGDDFDDGSDEPAEVFGLNMSEDSSGWDERIAMDQPDSGGRNGAGENGWDDDMDDDRGGPHDEDLEESEDPLDDETALGGGDAAIEPNGDQIGFEENLY